MEARILKELKLECFIDAGNLEGIKSLAKEGVNLNVKSLYGTMLMTAANISRWNVVQLLIDLGADINQPYGPFEWKFLHYAAKNSWIPVVQLFVDNQFDLDVKTLKDETALIVASHRNCFEIVTLLVNAGADVDLCDDKMMRAIHYASYKGNTEIVKFLAEKKADINAQNFKGSSALHLVVRNETDIKMIGVLLNLGVDCNMQDNEGTTAFNLIIRKGYLEEIKLAIEKGAYFQYMDYSRLLAKPLLKSNVLQKVNYCSQAIINKYNNKDLPDLYKVQVASNTLPDIEQIKLKYNGEVEIEIERAVNQDIKKRGYCDLMKVQPFILSKMCVESFLAYVRRKERLRVANETIPSPSCSASESERLAPKRMCYS